MSVPFFVYILASRRNGTLHLGYTDDIFRRVTEHKAHSLGGFTAKHNVDRPVWYETLESRESAWTREHRMKKWRRAWKLEPIALSRKGKSSAANALPCHANPMAHPRISRDPDVMLGKSVIKGTRITVELILRKCAAGMSTAAIVQSYPHIGEDDIRAALDYAADYLDHESIMAAV